VGQGVGIEKIPTHERNEKTEDRDGYDELAVLTDLSLCLYINNFFQFKVFTELLQAHGFDCLAIYCVMIGE